MILIDSRIGSADLAPFISTPHTTCTLDYADFAWAGQGQSGGVSIGVERKTILDLLGSMTSGRLSGHQIIGLKQAYDVVYLLVEGVCKADRKSGVLMRPGAKRKWQPVEHGSRRFMARELYAFLNSMQILCGVHVVRTSDKAESGKWLDSCFGWWAKPWTAHKSHQMWSRASEVAQFVKPTLAARMWAQFEGIGMDRARALAAKFPYPVDIFRAGKEELMSVEGVGAKLADSIIRQRNLGS